MGNPRTQGCPISKDLAEPRTAVPVVCCKAMIAECLACSSGMLVEEYCGENPSAQGCPTPLPTPAPAPLSTPEPTPTPSPVLAPLPPPDAKFVRPDCRPIWLNYGIQRHCSPSNILHT